MTTVIIPVGISMPSLLSRAAFFVYDIRHRGAAVPGKGRADAFRTLGRTRGGARQGAAAVSGQRT